MKAIRVSQFGGPELLQVETIPDPAPAAGQMLVKIYAAGVNPVDTYIRGGTYGTLPQLPYTPGVEGAGTVIPSGERVYLSATLTGTYAEYALCLPEHVHPLPQHLSFEQGAAISVAYATAYRALFHCARAKPGETVLVHGASGGVGIAAVQLAVGARMHVIATAGSAAGLQLLREQGAHEVRDHRQPDHLDGIAADVILEMLANVNLGRDLKAVAKGGRVVVIGSRGSVEIEPRDLMVRDASVLGMMLANVCCDELIEIHRTLGQMLASKRLWPVVGRRFPLEAAAEAHKAVMSPGACGKVVLVVVRE